jgi:hypothetical protein
MRFKFTAGVQAVGICREKSHFGSDSLEPRLLTGKRIPGWSFFALEESAFNRGTDPGVVHVGDYAQKSLICRQHPYQWAAAGCCIWTC